METEMVFLYAAGTCVTLSFIGGFTALKDGLSNDDKRNIFLLSSLLALWAIALLLAAIAAGCK